MSITIALPRNVAVKEIEERSAAGSALETDVLPALTDGFHLVIDALKLNGIATMAWFRTALHAKRGILWLARLWPLLV